jgi:lysine 2,3-aminomutase
METWQKFLQNSITTIAALKKHLDCDHNALEEVIANFPMRINPYFLKLILQHGTPLARQAIPDARELAEQPCLADPLAEEQYSKVPNLVHKYPDRVLFLVTGQCAMYCRFCTRKRKVGTSSFVVSRDTLRAGYDYIHRHPQIREVLVSGGDPLLLSDEALDDILCNLRKIPSVEIIRIGTRIPCVLPMRITRKLVRVLKKYHPLYINTHFNHPAEVTAAAGKACSLLADGGIPLGCQTVLLRGINDDAATITSLMRRLLAIRVKPYYLFQADLTMGTNHFRTPTKTGIAIMSQLYGHLSGMAVPTFALDSPDGRGKIPLTPQYIIESGHELTYRCYTGELGSYPEPVETF